VSVFLLSFHSDLWYEKTVLGANVGNSAILEPFDSPKSGCSKRFINIRLFWDLNRERSEMLEELKEPFGNSNLYHF
jgi:hypothetical protein